MALKQKLPRYARNDEESSPPEKPSTNPGSAVLKNFDH
jgi:hypothetical protein